MSEPTGIDQSWLEGLSCRGTGLEERPLALRAGGPERDWSGVGLGPFSSLEPVIFTVLTKADHS